ncbi:RNA polymerase sigma factor SigZ [Marivirga sp. S37H4]|uniref:RNA polymerase sigma factor SigZ n=1 Tax=Marivirga aurantiaca TaxID=2802615 RepID=A0A935C7W1_9BACT|nr:RNA polymerase sigma factor SigZ [Marivirga aurantiaca]MBK6265256.1 RNA polymerase sigma factor SigZ [Marivirga aurantiaca]
MTSEVTTIWTDFHKELKAFILNKTRNSADRDDILQDVFIKIIRNIDKINQAENVRHYLYGIVRNAINDYFRNRKQTVNDSEIVEKLTEEDTQSLNTTIAECCIKPLINKLPENYRDALLLTEFQDISQKDLAEKLNISYSGAKSRVQRGKEKLKELILDCCAYQSDKYGNLMDTEDENCGCA